MELPKTLREFAEIIEAIAMTQERLDTLLADRDRVQALIVAELLPALARPVHVPRDLVTGSPVLIAALHDLSAAPSINVADKVRSAMADRQWPCGPCPPADVADNVEAYPPPTPDWPEGPGPLATEPPPIQPQEAPVWPMPTPLPPSRTPGMPPAKAFAKPRSPFKPSRTIKASILARLADGPVSRQDLIQFVAAGNATNDATVAATISKMMQEDPPAMVRPAPAMYALPPKVAKGDSDG